MDKKDCGTMMNILQANYPSTYRGLTEKEAQALLNLWHEMFQEYDREIVILALKNYIRCEKYPPTIAGMQEQIDLLINKDNISELWTLLKKSINYRKYNENFEKLPKVLQTWLGYPIRLKELGQIKTDILNTVVYGQFFKQIPEIQKREFARKGLNEIEQIKMLGGKK